MEFTIFFVAHWYASIFTQSFFNHRYAAHQQFTMSAFWEKVFYVFSFLSMGSSYLSAHVYGMMHRVHHAYTDTDKDPHSPRYDPSLFAMMWRTRRIYLDIYKEQFPMEEKFTKNLPHWHWFDSMANMRIVRVLWILVYIAIYIALVGDTYWLYAFLPITILIGPVHGAFINWFSHLYGYRNFDTDEDSRNIIPVDVILLGECYHNNHHKYPSRSNFGVKWYEIDMLYPFIKLFSWLGIIKLKNQVA